MPRLFRICRKVYLPWDPGGAVRVAGRWHDLGQPVLYFSSSLALAVLEAKANGAEFAILRTDYHFTAIEMELVSGVVENVPDSFFRAGWFRSLEVTRRLGAFWCLEKRSLALGVFSAALRMERNFILNASHPRFKGLEFSPPASIPLDPRI